MRIANIRGRLALLTEGGARTLDSDDDIEVFRSILASPGVDVVDMDRTSAIEEYADSDLSPPVWGVGAIWGLGYNYSAHNDEVESPRSPLAFLKSPATVANPFAPIAITGLEMDYEVELVVVIGRTARNVTPEAAWEFIGGLTIGQDITDRGLQRAGQLDLSKSAPGTSPIGPILVTRDEFDPSLEGLSIQCMLGEETAQAGLLTDMIWSPSEIVSRFSKATELQPGDLIFTGTPSGVGLHREPPRFLRAGDTITSRIEGIGEIRNECR